MQPENRPEETTAARAPLAPLPFPWPDLSGIHAFLIEDNEDTRVLVGDTLEYCGAVVSVYSSADAAMADLPEFVPTVFICDLSMPGLDGLQFLRRMRELPAERGGQIPAIAITAYYEDFASAAALEAGFNAYMLKPIKLEELARLVKEITTRTP